MQKWGFNKDGHTTCECGDEQTTKHLLVSTIPPQPCTHEDPEEFNPELDPASSIGRGRVVTRKEVFFRSAGPPSPPQLLYTRSLRHVLFDEPLSPFFHLHTLHLDPGTRKCPPESVSSPPVRCPVKLFFPLVAYVQHFRLL